jgi:hypothetical protein
MFNPRAPADPYIALDIDRHSVRQSPIVATRTNPVREYDAVAKSAARSTDRLFTLAMLLEPPQFMQSGAGHLTNAGEWVTKNGTFDLQALVDARICELNLSPALLNRWLDTPVGSVANDQAFWRGTFESRMERFRK